jgi:hypothetical protein
VIIATGLVLTSFSQNTHFGVKAGLNSSSIKISDGEDYDSKLGFHIGGLAHIHISKHFAVQPELMFSTQGGQDDGDDFKLKLNYINLPVLAQYMFDGGFRLQTGPQIGFLTGAETKEGDVEIDVDDQIQSIDFSWVFGGSYLFPNGFGVDARYNLGISNISDISGFEAKNRVFQFGVFYQFMH